MSLSFQSADKYHQPPTSDLIVNAASPLDRSTPIRFTQDLKVVPVEAPQPIPAASKAPHDSLPGAHDHLEISPAMELEPIDDTKKEVLFRKLSPLAREGHDMGSNWMAQRYFDDPSEGVVRVFEHKPGKLIENGREVLGAITHDRTHLPDGLLEAYTLYIRPATEDEPQGIDMKKHAGTGALHEWKPSGPDASEAEEFVAIMGLAVALSSHIQARREEEKTGLSFVSQADGERLMDLLDRSKSWEDHIKTIKPQ